MSSREKRLGELIRRAREGADLSQETVAAAIGVHQSSISDWEKGKGAPGVYDLLTIARITSRGLSFFIPEYDSNLREVELAAPRKERNPHAVVQAA